MSRDEACHMNEKQQMSRGEVLRGSVAHTHTHTRTAHLFESVAMDTTMLYTHMHAQKHKHTHTYLQLAPYLLRLVSVGACITREFAFQLVAIDLLLALLLAVGVRCVFGCLKHVLCVSVHVCVMNTRLHAFLCTLCMKQSTSEHTGTPPHPCKLLYYLQLLY